MPCARTRATKDSTKPPAVSSWWCVVSAKGPFRDKELARKAGRKGGQASAAARRAAKEPWTGSIIDLMDLAGMVGEEWSAWRAFWKACYALPMSADELVTYQRHTKRDNAPAAPVAEAWMA